MASDAFMMITDNESAKMVSSKGVIQGYNGITMVADKNQVVVNAVDPRTGRKRPEAKRR